MAVPIHKTGLWKTLGQKSSAIVSTNLIGNFVPSLGIASSSWTNQAASNALRRYNGITYNSSSPQNFQFDGTDDYLGEASSGYGGTAFKVHIRNAYTVGQWVYLPSTWSSGNKHLMFMIYSTDSNLTYAYIEGQTMKMETKYNFGTHGPSSIGSVVNLINNKDKWLYHTISHDGSAVFKYYINGSFIDSVDAFNVPLGSASPFYVGYKRTSGSSWYTSANVKVGHIHVHDSELNSSQIRQNYLAIASPVNTRLYGETALA